MKTRIVLILIAIQTMVGTYDSFAANTVNWETSPTATSYQISMAWSYSPDGDCPDPLDHFVLYRGTSPTSMQAYQNLGTSTSYTDVINVGSKQYYYYVLAVAQSASYSSTTQNATTNASVISIQCNSPVGEADGQTNGSVTLNYPSAVRVDFRYATQNNTAVAPGDYTAVDNSTYLAAGATSYGFSVQIANDTAVEATENFKINLSNLVNASAGTVQRTVNINDNDVTRPHINTPSLVNHYSVSLSWSGYAPNPYDSCPDPIGHYEVWISDTSDFASHTTINVGTNTSYVHAVNLGKKTKYYKVYAVTQDFGTYIPCDNPYVSATTDPSTVLVHYSSPVTEAPNAVTSITLLLSPQSTVQVVAKCKTEGDTAGAGSDFTSTDHTATITTDYPQVRTFNVPITDDDWFEGQESYKLNLYYIDANGRADTTYYTALINDNESTPVLSLATIDNSSEGAGPINVSVRLWPMSPSAVTANLNFVSESSQVEYGTGRDLTIPSPSITFNSGETSKSVSVEVYDDEIAESSETARFNVSRVSGVAMTGSSSTTSTQVVDNDSLPLIDFTTGQSLGKPTLDYSVNTPTDQLKRIRIFKAEPRFAPDRMNVTKIYDELVTRTRDVIRDSSYVKYGELAKPTNMSSSPQPTNDTIAGKSITISWTKCDDEVISHLYAMEAVQRCTATTSDGLVSDCLSKDRTFETMPPVAGTTPSRLTYISGSQTGISIATDCNVTTAPGYKALKINNSSSSVILAYTLNASELTTVGTDQDFLVSAWHRSDGTPGVLSLQYTTDSGSTWQDADSSAALQTTVADDSWRQIQFYAKVPTGSYNGLRLVMESTATNSYWDELSLKKMTSCDETRKIDAYELYMTDSSQEPSVGCKILASYGCAATSDSTHTFDNLSDGTYYAHLRASDVYGNRSQWVHLGYWKIEQTPPLAPVLEDIEDSTSADPDKYIRGSFTATGRYDGPLTGTTQLSIMVFAENATSGTVVASWPASANIDAENRHFTGSGALNADARYRFYATATKVVAGQNITSEHSNNIYRTRDGNGPSFGGLVRAVPRFEDTNTTNVRIELTWPRATDSGSGVKYYDVMTTTGTEISGPPSHTIASDGSTTYTYTWSSYDRNAAKTIFAIKAVDAAGNESSVGDTKWIYGAPSFFGNWNVVPNEWTTTFTLTFNATESEGRRMHVWGIDISNIPYVTHGWHQFQSPITPRLLATRNSSKRIFAQGVDALGNYTVPIQCGAWFEEPRVLSAIDLMKVTDQTSASLAISATYASGTDISAVLVGWDQYGMPFSLSNIYEQFTYDIKPTTKSLTLQRNGGNLSIHCGLLGGGMIIVRYIPDLAIETHKGFNITQPGVLSRIQVGGPEFLKSGAPGQYAAMGYDQDGNPIQEIEAKWFAGQLGHINSVGTLYACQTDSVLTGTVQAESGALIGECSVLIDGKPPIVLDVDLNPGPDGNVEIDSAPQQISVVTLPHEEHLLPAKFSVYLDNRYVGSVTKNDLTETTITSAELTFNPATLRAGLHKISVISIDDLGNTNKSAPYVEYFRTPAGDPPSSVTDWLLVYQNLQDGPEYGSWILDGHDWSYHRTGIVDQTTDTVAATTQEVAEALLTLSEFDPDYISRENNYTVQTKITVQESIDAGLTYLTGVMLDGGVRDPLTRMLAADTILELRDRGGDVVLPDTRTGEPVTIAWDDVIVSATAIVRENLNRNSDGGLGALGLNGSSHMATMMAMRLALATTTTLSAQELGAQIEDWKDYLTHHYEWIEGSKVDLGETGGWALHQSDWWNQARVTYHSAEILRTMNMLSKRCGSDAEIDRLKGDARDFILARKHDAGGFGDCVPQDSTQITTASVVSTASCLLALKEADLIDTPTLTTGVAYLNASMISDNSWNRRALDTALVLRLMKPDLTFRSIGRPIYNRTTGYTDYSVVISNIGAWPAYAFELTAHSSDPKYDSAARRDVTRIGRSAGVITVLGPNETKTVVVQLEETAPYIYFMLDSSEQVQELAEDNNIMSCAPDPRPDMVVYEPGIKFGKITAFNDFITTSPQYLDESWAISVPIKNIGLGGVKEIDDARVHLYFGGTYPDPNAIEIGYPPERTVISDIGPSQTYTYRFEIGNALIGKGLTAGDYKVCFRIDSGNVREIRTDNNMWTGTVTLIPRTLNGTPDLVVSSLTIDPPNPEAGKDFNIYVELENIGDGNAVDPEAQVAVGGVYSNVLTAPGIIVSKGHARYEFSGMLLAPGGVVTAIADPDECVREILENNNTRDLNVAVPPPDIYNLAVMKNVVITRKKDGNFDLSVTIKNDSLKAYDPTPTPPRLMATRLQEDNFVSINGIGTIPIDQTLVSEASQVFTWTNFPFVAGQTNTIKLELINNQDGSPYDDSIIIAPFIPPQAANLELVGLRAESIVPKLQSGKTTAPFRFHYQFNNTSTDTLKNVTVALSNAKDERLWSKTFSDIAATTTVTGVTEYIEFHPTQTLVKFSVDSEKQIVESREDDNTSWTTVVIEMDRVDPDLAFTTTTVTMQTLYSGGQDPRYRLVIQAENKLGTAGTPSYSGEFKVRVYDECVTGTLLGVAESEGIAGGDSKSIGIELTDSAIGEEILIVLDADDEVTETNEQNNELRVTAERVPKPANLTARSILQDGRLAWRNGLELGADDYITTAGLDGYRILRTPAWSSDDSKWVAKTESGNYIFYDRGLDAATTYTYRVVAVATTGMQSEPRIGSLRTCSVPIIEAFHKGNQIESGAVIMAGSSSDTTIQLRVAAPQADKVLLYQDRATTATELDDTVENGVFYTTCTLHLGRQKFIAQPKVVFNDGVETAVLGNLSDPFEVSYETGIDLAVTSSEMQVQHWEDAGWKDIAVKDINKLQGEHKFRVRATVHNIETEPSGDFYLRFRWKTNNRSLGVDTGTSQTEEVLVNSLQAGGSETLYNCNNAEDSTVFVKAADRVVQEISVKADSRNAIVETLESNNYATMIAAEYGNCHSKYDFVFMLDVSGENNITSFARCKDELRKWVTDLNNAKHRVGVITFNRSGATTVTEGLMSPTNVLPLLDGIPDYPDPDTIDGRNLEAALKIAKNLFFAGSNGANGAKPVVVLIESGHSSDYDGNGKIDPGTETDDIVVAIREAGKLKRDVASIYETNDNPENPLHIYQVHFNQSASDKYANDSWLWTEEAYFMRMMNSTSDAELWFTDGVGNRLTDQNNPYFKISQYTGQDDASVMSDDLNYKLEADLTSNKNFIGEIPLQFERYWLEGTSQLLPNISVRQRPETEVLATLKGDRSWRPIVLWPKWKRLPVWLTEEAYRHRCQDLGYWLTEGRFGFRHWMLNYSIQNGEQVSEYEMYIGGVGTWYPFNVYGSMLSTGEQIEYTMFIRGDEQMPTMFQLPQEPWYPERIQAAVKFIDDHVILGNTAYNRDRDGFTFYYPGVCPPSQHGLDIAVYFYRSSKDTAIDHSNEPGDVGFPGGTPRLNESGELMAYVRNCGDTTVSSATVIFSTEPEIAPPHIVTNLAPGEIRAVRAANEWTNIGEPETTLTVSVSPSEDEIPLGNNQDSLTIYNTPDKLPNLRWGATKVNGKIEPNCGNIVIPVKWGVDLTADVDVEFYCDKLYIPTVKVKKDSYDPTVERVNLGTSIYHIEEIIPTDISNTGAGRNITLDPHGAEFGDYGDVLESDEEDNDKHIGLTYQYLFQDVEVSDLRCVKRDTDGTIHLVATVKRNYVEGENYTFENVSAYLFPGEWVENSEDLVPLDAANVKFDSASTGLARQVELTVKADPKTTVTLSVVADPFAKELHEHPVGGRSNNSQTTTVLPCYINLKPVSLAMTVDGETTDTIERGLNGALDFVSLYGFGDDIPTSVSYKVRFWMNYPGRFEGEPIAEQIIRNHERTNPNRMITQILKTNDLLGTVSLYAEIDPRDHVAAAASDHPSTVPLMQSRPWALAPVAPQLYSAIAPGTWYIDVAVANASDSTSYTTVAQWRSDQPDQPIVGMTSAAGPILLRLRSDSGLPTFTSGDVIKLNFGQLNTSMLARPDDEATTLATTNGWYSEATNITPSMDYYTTDSTRSGKILHLATHTTGTIVGSFLLGDNHSDSLNNYDTPFPSPARPCVNMWYKNLNTSETLTIEFLVESTSGSLTMRFDTANTVTLGDETHLNYPLGAAGRSGYWENIFLDLATYLNIYKPGASIQSVDGIRIRSNNVLIDDIVMGQNRLDFYTASTDVSSITVHLPKTHGAWDSAALWVATDGSTYFANSMHLMANPNGDSVAPANVDLSAAKAMLDALGCVEEIYESDNIEQMIIRVVDTGSIDMAIEDLAANKDIYDPGDPILLNANLKNILSEHKFRGKIVVYANDKPVTTHPVETAGVWRRDESRVETIDVPNCGLRGPVVNLRAVLIVPEDSNPGNNTAETSITLSATVSLGIGDPMPSIIEPGDPVHFDVMPRSTRSLLADVPLWLIPADASNEAGAVATLDGLSNCAVTSSGSHAMTWAGDTRIHAGSYRVYGKLKINGNVAATTMSTPFSIVRNPQLEVTIGTDQYCYVEGSTVKIVYSVTDPSRSTPLDSPTTITIGVHSRDYSTTFTTCVVRLVADQTLSFEDTLRKLPNGQYDAVALAVCPGENLSDCAGTSFNVGAVGETPLEQLRIGNAVSSNPLYTNSLQTTLSLQSVGLHTMDSNDFMWLSDAQPLAIENNLTNGDMAVPDGSGAKGWSGGARVTMGSGWGLQITSATSVRSLDPIRVLPLQNYCLSFIADRMTSDITINVTNYSIGNLKAGEAVELGCGGRGAWDGAHYRYEVPLRTVDGAHQLGLQFDWSGTGDIVVSDLQLTPGSVGATYRNNVAGARVNLIENQVPIIDSGMAMDRIQPSLTLDMDNHDNAIPDGWRFDGDGTVTLGIDESLCSELKAAGVRSSTTLVADVGATCALSQRMIPVRPGDQIHLSLYSKGNGAVSILGYGENASAPSNRWDTDLASSLWTTATATVTIPISPTVYNLAIEVTTPDSLSIAALSMADGGRSATQWSGWIPYGPDMARTLADGADGLRSVHARYLTNAGDISLHGLVALTRDADGNGYPDAISGSTLTTTGIAAAVDGNVATTTMVDSATSVGLTFSVPGVHYVESLRLAADLVSTATLGIEASLDGSIWMPVVSGMAVSPGARDLLVPIRLAMSHWRIRLTAAGGISGQIGEIELRGLTSSEADTVIVDRVSPAAYVHLDTPVRTNAQSAGFSGTAADELSGIGRIEYRLVSPDATTTEPIAAAGIPSLNVDYSISLPVAAEGAHYLFVHAIDQAGNESAETSTSLTVDRTGPTLTITRPTSGTLSNAPVEVAWTVEDPYVASAHGIDWLRPFGSIEVTTSSISSGQQATAEGRHTVTAWAVDDLGNVGPTTSTVFVIDMTSPTVTLVPAIAGPRTNHVELSYSGTAGDGADQSGLAAVEISFNAGAWSSVSFDPQTGDYSAMFTVSDSGVNEVRARSIDQAGNVSAIASHSIEIDLDAPLMRIDEPTSGTWHNTDTLMRWSTPATDLATSHGTLSWRSLDGMTTAVLSVKSGDHATSEGRYLLAVGGTDVAGNDGPTTMTAFAVDKTSPTVTLLPIFTNPTKLMALPYHGTASDGHDQSGLAVVQVRLDSGAWTNVPFDTVGGDYATTVTVETEGVHYVYARSIDAVGNVSVIASHTFNVDRTPPAMRIDEPTSGTWHNTDTLMRWSTPATDLATSHGTLSWRSLDSMTTSVLNIKSGDHAILEGRYLLAVGGTDVAGNDGPTTMTVFAVDKTAPVQTITATAGMTSDGNVRRDGSAHDGFGSGLGAIEYRLHQTGSWIGITNVSSDPIEGIPTRVLWNVDLNLPHGVHVFELRARDAANNVSVPTSDTIRVDLQPPVITFTQPQAGSTVSGQFTLAINASDDIAGVASIRFKIEQNDEPWRSFSQSNGDSHSLNCSTSLDSTLFYDGPTTFTVEAVDQLGNTGTGRIVLNIDNDQPPQAPTGVVAYFIDRNKVRLHWNLNSEPDFASYRLYRAVGQNITDSNRIFVNDLITTATWVDDSITTSTPNYYYYVIKAVDKADNISQASEKFTTPPPQAPENLIAIGRNGSADLSWKEVVEGYIIGYDIFRRTTGAYSFIDGTTSSETIQYANLNLDNQTTYTYYVTSVDGAYNQSGPSNIATVAPGVTPTIRSCHVIAFEDLKNQGTVDWDFNDVTVMTTTTLQLDANDCVSTITMTYTALIKDAGYTHAVMLDIKDLQSTATVRVTSYNNGSSSPYSITNSSYHWDPVDLNSISVFANTTNGVSGSGGVVGDRVIVRIGLQHPELNPLGTFDKPPFDTWIHISNTSQDVHVYDPETGDYMDDNQQVINDDYLEGVYLNFGLIVPDSNFRPSSTAGVKLWSLYPDFVGYARSVRTKVIQNPTWYKK